MAIDGTSRQPRSRAHRGLLFEYMLGVSLVVMGLVGMTVMQARLVLLSYTDNDTGTVLGFWRGDPVYDGDDVRSLSDSLRVCGDGLGRAVELDCWRDQMAALLPPRAGDAAIALQRHRVMVRGVERDVIVFGGLPAPAQGFGITVVDAATGSVIWHARHAAHTGFDASIGGFGHALLVDPIGDEIAAVDGDRDGLVDRLYAGDAGGRLWRVDLAGIADGMPRVVDNVLGDEPSLWSITPIFSAGARDAGLGGTSLNQRRFESRPEVVQASDPQGRYDAVIIGSTGDRPEVENWLYMVKDRGVVSGMPVVDDGLEHSDLRDLSARCDETEICKGGRAGLAKGWRLRLATTGERFSGRALTAAGSVLFTTWTPFGAGCDGRRMLYSVSLRDARRGFSIDSTTETNPVAREIIEIIERSSHVEPCHVADRTG